MCMLRLVQYREDVSNRLLVHIFLTACTPLSIHHRIHVSSYQLINVSTYQFGLGLCADLTESEWVTVDDNIEPIPGKAFLVSQLYPNSKYIFRVSALSWAGWGTHGDPCRAVRTKLARPSAPQEPLMTKIGVNWCELKWTEPACHGSPLEAYVEERQRESRVLYVEDGRSEGRS